MDNQYIIIKGARENNLKNVSVKIPKKKITVFTGISGSGKSSLVFDTIAAESQRLLNETYNSFIRHRLQQYGKPDVDSMQNLSVAIVIDQKRIKGNARSTVGTITDIYLYLRLIYSRIGKPFVGYSNVFSFNNPIGMCPHCEGLGKVNTLDLNELIDKNKSLNEGAIDFPTLEVGGWRWTRYAYSGLFDNDKKIKDYTDQEWRNLVYADNIKLENPDPRFPKTSPYEGLLPRFERTFFKKESKEITGKNAVRFNEVVTQSTCPVCHGARLNPTILSCKIGTKNIADCCNIQIDELLEFIKSLNDAHIQPVLDTIAERLESLTSIGLEYLSLNRETSTLSGGESQRVKLVRHLSSSLTDLCYIFDEPSIGLHPSDVHRLNKLLIELRDKGNTILIVEHDPDVIAIADHIIDMGVGAGRDGGRIVYEGNWSGLLRSNTLTGKYLSQKQSIKNFYRTTADFLSLHNVSLHNLKQISVNIPKHIMTVIAGVAGSGKSSLIEALQKKYSEIVMIDQSAIRGSKRSNTATYTGIMDLIRNSFAKANKVKASLFSNNSEGACKACKGLGIISTDLAFMDSVEVRCDVCNGSGYDPAIAKYKLNGKSISEVMSMTITDAKIFFPEKEIQPILKNLDDVGLGYITIGQPLNTLSGGERQRLKLAIELGKEEQIYIFDEPTTGLHGSDIAKLSKLFDQLIDLSKNTVIIIEHNLDIISQADWIIEMGPKGGRNGGEIVFEGHPKDIVEDENSLTGIYLKKYIDR